MSTTDGNPWLVTYQDPRSTATPPVDAAVERFMATYRTPTDDGDFFRGVCNALKLTIPFWVWLIHRVVS